MLLSKQKKNQAAVKGNRILISINVPGSAGPLRFVVSEEDLVATVIDTALKCYAREGRLPVLGSKLDEFQLYSAHAGTGAVSPWVTIGSLGTRNFLLCKKPDSEKMMDGAKSPAPITRKGSPTWKLWINKSFTKSLSHRISSH